MTKNLFTIKSSRGHLFYFKHEPDNPDLLHMYVRHLTIPEDAIKAFFTGTTMWNQTRQRFQTTTRSHTVFWIWLDKEYKKVLIITCFTPHFL